MSYRALVISEANNMFIKEIKQIEFQELKPDCVRIKVLYSSLNYKDALSSSGNKGVTRSYPHVPGIDAAGIIEESHSNLFKKGDEVIVTGYDLGMDTDGGFGEFIDIPANWVVKKPSSLSFKNAMLYGTAGFTAALSVKRMVDHGIKPEDGKILVTGATGGVGSIAMSILSHLGYHVVAVTGKTHLKEQLLLNGASEVIDRSDLTQLGTKMLAKPVWAAAIDTVGGEYLSSAVKSTAYNGCVTCCGNVASPDFELNVYPFILRGVTLYGIDSVQCTMPLRTKIWDLLSDGWSIVESFKTIQTVSLSEIETQIDLMLKGKHSGRTILEHHH
ncbi:YhdH/YhfP family quinone oxidoreductase [Fusibacter ferrireducens]|uniref:YhdH/YhfP family quinone oxidoreductase n=1 Tax=Fusibacter ferrireducens TaxID=2785058 RepID=A0ABR9ZSY3_9FIRM|nr:YhdH/YhfP family quinone oxidoreductase [Fusibacter ferrireducens]MBF4693581.1 YhdH/YhfP family quinone oxidoreductase [Fusibacter ferrireducens]